MDSVPNEWKQKLKTIKTLYPYKGTRKVKDF